MGRLEVFQSLSQHAWLGRSFKRLTADEIDLAAQFIRANNALDLGAFEMAVQRMFLGMAKKPKNWTILNELLICANSGAFRTRSRTV